MLHGPGAQVLDLHEPPYRGYLELLDALRVSALAWPRVAYAEAHCEERGTHDAHELERARVAHLLLFDASPRDLSLMRFLLDQEIAARSSDDFQGAGDALTILSLLLLEHGDSSDAWRFWQAKRANFDTWAGGYDLEFVLACLSPQQLEQMLEQRAPDDLDLLEDYDLEALHAEMGGWRTQMDGRYPRGAEQLTVTDCEIWAELFGDREGLERYGLLGACTPEARACLYRRLERHEDAVACWRAAAARAPSSWDRISLLTHALGDAAKVPLASLDEAAQIDRLRAEVPSWPEVGLGRMATQACYELAAAVDDPACGRALWETAQRWRAELDSFPLAGLRAAREAACRWGTPCEREELTEEIADERARIDAMDD
jgi:hypothetical protein